MKYCIIVPDGMADLPVAELDGKTPLDAADTPNMDRIATEGRCGEVHTVPEGMHADSDVAMLSVMGYDPREYHRGRAPVEALGMGMDLSGSRIYFRCNLVTLDDDTMADHSGGHIGDREAAILIELLNEKAAPEGVRFHAGAGYRCIMSCPEGMAGPCKTTAPQDILDELIDDHMPEGDGCAWLVDLMEQSRELFAEHDINRVRADLGENPVSMIWLWGQGPPLWMPTFAERYKVSGAVVAAVPLVRGLGLAVGWEAPLIPGATGYFDTDYAAKANAALGLLVDHDLVLVHIEAPDEVSHAGNIEQKVDCIERIDADIVGPVLQRFEDPEFGRMLVLPDHVTSVEQRRHLDAPVPFAIRGIRMESVVDRPYSEAAVAEADLDVKNGHDLMAFLLRK